MEVLVRVDKVDRAGKPSTQTLKALGLREAFRVACDESKKREPGEFMVVTVGAGKVVGSGL